MLFFVLKSKGESTKSFNFEMKKSQKGRKRYSNISIGIFQNLPPGGSAGKESTCNMETWVQSLGWEDPLVKGKAPHSSILAWRTPWTV